MSPIAAVSPIAAIAAVSTVSAIAREITLAAVSAMPAVATAAAIPTSAADTGYSYIHIIEPASEVFRRQASFPHLKNHQSFLIVHRANFPGYDTHIGTRTTPATVLPMTPVPSIAAAAAPP